MGISYCTMFWNVAVFCGSWTVILLTGDSVRRHWPNADMGDAVGG